MSIIQWLEDHMLQCPSKALFHIDCPGCGFQRAFVALIKGDVFHSLFLYPALMPILFTLSYTFLHLRFHFRHGARNIKILQATSALIIVCFYIYKVINNQLTN